MLGTKMCFMVLGLRVKSLGAGPQVWVYICRGGNTWGMEAGGESLLSEQRKRGRFKRRGLFLTL